MISARDELASLDLLPARETAALAEAGHTTAAGLLEHLPKRYEDRRRFDRFPNQPTDRAVCVRGTVIDAMKRSFGRARGFFEVVLLDGSGGVFGSGKITCRWFNMPYIHKIIASCQDLVVYGRVKDSGGRLVIDHPEFEVLREDDDESDSIHIERIVPIYRNISGIAQRRLREIMHLLLQRVDPQTLESSIEIDASGSRGGILKDVHFPDSIESAKAALRGLALEEFHIAATPMAEGEIRPAGQVLRTQAAMQHLLHEILRRHGGQRLVEGQRELLDRRHALSPGDGDGARMARRPGRVNPAHPCLPIGT